VSRITRMTNVNRQPKANSPTKLLTDRRPACDLHQSRGDAGGSLYDVL
jgi:hypothetical protein